MNAVKQLISNCKKTANQHGWVDGYNAPNNKAMQLALIKQIAASGIAPRKIQNQYPNVGTYTYTDGIVDYVLGLYAMFSIA
jgi:hypothetical protein